MTNQKKISNALSVIKKGTQASKKGQKYFEGGRLSKEFLTNFTTGIIDFLSLSNNAIYLDVDNLFSDVSDNTERIEAIEIVIGEGFDYDLLLKPSDHGKTFRYVGENNAGSVTLPLSTEFAEQNAPQTEFEVTIINDSPDKSTVNIIAQDSNLIDNLQLVDLRWTEIKNVIWGGGDLYTTIEISRTDRLKWRGTFSPESFYLENDCTIDEGYLMAANKDTNEKPAPQRVGDPTYDLPDVPGFAENNFAGFVRSGHIYTFATGGWAQRLEVFVPAFNVDTGYAIKVVDLTDPNNVTTSTIIPTLLTPNAWTAIAGLNQPILPGTVLSVILESLDLSSSGGFVGDWTRQSDSNNGAPSIRNWRRRSNDSVVRIHNTDDATIDRSLELVGVVAGSTLKFTQFDDSNKSVTYTCQGNAIAVGSGPNAYHEWVTTRQAIGSGGMPDTDKVSNTLVTIPTSVSTAYNQLTPAWPANNPSWATVTGQLEIGGVAQSVPLDGFGVRVRFQEAFLSDDWDFMAFTDIGGSPEEEVSLLINPFSVVPALGSYRVETPGNYNIPLWFDFFSKGINRIVLKNVSGDVITLNTQSADVIEWEVGRLAETSFVMQDQESILVQLVKTQIFDIIHYTEDKTHKKHFFVQSGFPFTTSSATYVVASTNVTPVIAKGFYKVSLNGSFGATAANRSFNIIVFIDGIQLNITPYIKEPKSAGDRYPVAFKFIVDFTASAVTHTVELQIKKDGGGGVADVQVFDWRYTLEKWSN